MHAALGILYALLVEFVHAAHFVHGGVEPGLVRHVRKSEFAENLLLNGADPGLAQAAVVDMMLLFYHRFRLAQLVGHTHGDGERHHVAQPDVHDDLNQLSEVPMIGYKKKPQRLQCELVKS